MREEKGKSQKEEMKRIQRLTRYRRMLEEKVEDTQGRKAPACTLCRFYQPDFSYRRCLFTACPYGKDTDVFRRSPKNKNRKKYGNASRSRRKGGSHV